MRADRWDAQYAGHRLEEHIAELLLLTPALRAALARDHTPETGNRVTVGGITLSLPVNADVHRALAEIPIGYLYSYTAQFWHAVTTGNEAAAKRISRDVDYWRRLAKRALGLLHYDRRLGQPCPQHDDPLTELVALGDEGWLRSDRHGLYVDWTRDQRVWCRHCGSVWGPREMLLLGRLLRWADERRRSYASAMTEPEEPTGAEESQDDTGTEAASAEADADGD